MKKAVLVAFALLTGALAASPAFAWGHSRVIVGFNFGFPVYGYAPYYYPPPVYYPAAPVVVQSAPPVYVERNDMPPQAAAPQAQAQSFWYYCAGAKGYYPYVKDCPGGWQRVSPTPQ